MKHIKSIAVAAALSAALSCSRSNDSVSQAVTVGPYSSINEIYSTLMVQPMVVNYNASDDTSFYGASGTRYVFYGNTLMTGGGIIVTGTVQLHVSEYLQKGDMMFSKMLPISNNEPLISGGEISVSATQSGQNLLLRPGCAFQAHVPQNGAATTGMTFFSGVTATDTSVAKVNWVATVDSPNSYIVAAGDTVDIISDSLILCNADHFLSSPVYQNFTVTVLVPGISLATSNTGNNTTIKGYTLYDNYKGELPLGWVGGYANGVYTEEHVPNIPVHFVVFGIINGYFYGGIMGTTPVTGNNYTVTLSKIDPVAFKAQVNAL